MKRKQWRRMLMGGLLLGCGALQMLACVSSYKAGNTCGTNDPGSCSNNCTKTVCGDRASTCGGPVTDYNCTASSYTANCTTSVGSKVEWVDDYGERHCECGSFKETSTSGVACSKVTAEVSGCQ